ncbi:TetR/AcrR family transcriptional regulator [Streptomyces parvus]|uniref:TetR family transcriptional regulator n=1 Tax=Streptomyces parvus TaxID=66428 RepID=A0A7K3RR91_9ACTN|nr:TetR/AcrR family transcriptional regulator [Streptomyces parvus]NEC17719.1 TetR family transcriptional regulator [Streptomyces parvus]
MPRVSDAYLAARREQVLDAVRICVDRSGLQGATMEGIIQASGMSTGTVYKYIRSKDEGIEAAMGTTLDGLTLALLPHLTAEPLPPPPVVMEQLMTTLEEFTRREDYSLLRVAMHGWSAALSNPDLLDKTAGTYRAFRDLLQGAATTWRADGHLPEDADPADVAASLLALMMGFAAQQGMLGDTGAAAQARGFAALFGSGQGEEPAQKRTTPRPRAARKR